MSGVDDTLLVDRSLGTDSHSVRKCSAHREVNGAAPVGSSVGCMGGSGHVSSTRFASMGDARPRLP